MQSTQTENIAPLQVDEVSVEKVSNAQTESPVDKKSVVVEETPVKQEVEADKENKQEEVNCYSQVELENLFKSPEQMKEHESAKKTYQRALTPISQMSDGSSEDDIS